MLLSGFSCISALTSICLAQITTPPTVEIVTDQSGNDLTSYVSVRQLDATFRTGTDPDYSDQIFAHQDTMSPSMFPIKSLQDTGS